MRRVLVEARSPVLLAKPLPILSGMEMAESVGTLSFEPSPGSTRLAPPNGAWDRLAVAGVLRSPFFLKPTKVFEMKRRDFGALLAGSVIAGVAGSANAVAADAGVQLSEDKFPPMHTGRKPEIGMLVYPGLTLLDMLGPQTVLSTSCNVHLVWKNDGLIESDTGVVIRPTGKFADCPTELDAIFVGGGPGQIAVMQDPEVLKFLADRGSRAKYVTSVCSGSLVLGAAGLLQGYKASCHWALHPAIAKVGAIPEQGRVVTDRNRVTGGGVTAGIDFALVLLAKLLGEDIAKMTQLALEYDPTPPFDAGTPEKAGEKLTKRVQDWIGPLSGQFATTCDSASKNMSKYAPKP